MKQFTPWLALLAVWLAVSLACSSATTTDYNGLKGSASESNTSTSTSGKTGVISGELNQLSGTLTKTVENKNLRLSDTEAAVTVTLTVGTGTVQVYIQPKSGPAAEKVVKAGESGSFTARAPISASKFQVFFEAQGGEAGGVKYSIKYSTP